MRLTLPAYVSTDIVTRWTGRKLTISSITYAIRAAMSKRTRRLIDRLPEELVF